MSELNFFRRAFSALTDVAPFRWQQRLYQKMLKGDFPLVCDLPTGLGKTMVIPIWLIALGAQSLAAGGNRLPRRLIYIVNRSGNRPSHEQAAEYFDRAVALCRRAGFRRIRLRGDTDFTQTTHLDRWHEDNVQFVFGIDAMPNLYDIAENLPFSAWKVFERKPRYEVKTQPRQRPANVKQPIVEDREFTDIRLVREYVAEFTYRPTNCRRSYRVVVLWKDLEEHKGQQKLFDTSKCVFYITNDWDAPAEQIVCEANHRCNQENLIEQHKNGVHALTAPVDNLESNWAYMVIASLAWSLKVWSALLLPVQGRWREKHERERNQLLRMDFVTYRNAFMNIPAQIIRTGGRIIYRMLAWNPWQNAFFRLASQLRCPLRC
jgi:hypothetical protein